jgi:bifunctional non-homologous end joining protein LigD
LGFIGAQGFDALLVGVYENKELLFVKKKKNDFVPRLRDEIFPTLKRLIAARCPFTNLPEKRASRWGESLTAEKMKECRWLDPALVGQIEFVEWTPDSHLRHARFMGLRDGQAPLDVVRRA